MSRNGPEISTNSDEIVALGAYRYDPASAVLTDVTGAEVALRSQSHQVLCVLTRAAGATVSKNTLIETVWGDTFVTDDSLVQCIADIRRALGDRDHRLIVTLPRKGYRLNAARPDPKDIAPPLPSLSGRRSIAVLPFTNLSSDPKQAFFAEGLTEDLIARLSMVRLLTVLATPSAFAFSGDAMRLEDAFAQLTPEFLLKGAVRRAENMVRVTIQLIENDGGTVVLSRRFDKELHDIFAIQDDIVSQIITETQVALTEGEASRLASRGTRSVAAWEYFHQGLLEHLKYTPPANQQARRLFAMALDEDPDYSDPMFADGWALWIAARSSYWADPEADLRDCRALVDALIKRMPEAPDTLYLDAALLLLEGQFEQAVERAEQGYKTGHSLFYERGVTPLVHLYCGNLERARDLFLEVINAAPVVPDDTLHYYAHCLTLLGEYNEALALAGEYRHRVPGTVYGFTLLATAQGLAGQIEAAAATVLALRRAHPQFTLGVFRRHEPYRDTQTLARISRVLGEAGLLE